MCGKESVSSLHLKNNIGKKYIKLNTL